MLFVIQNLSILSSIFNLSIKDKIMLINTGTLANHLEASLIGSDTINLRGVAGIEYATLDKITFLSEDKYLNILKTSHAGAVMLSRHIDEIKIPQIILSL